MGFRVIRLISISALVVAGSLALVIAGFAQSSSAGPASAQGAGVTGQFIWAARDDGTIGVYDVNHPFSLVRTIHVFSGTADVRGATAAAATHMFYVMYNQHSHGYVAKVDLISHRVVWDKDLHNPGVDRGNVTPDGQTLYLPTWESDPTSPYELVVNAVTGAIKGKITGGTTAFPARSHDTIVSLDGRYVFMETKSPTGTLYVASTVSNRIVRTITGYCCTHVLAPFSVNRAGTLVVNNVNGLYGFQVGSVSTGKVIATVPLTGTKGHAGLHGIAWTPNEKEVWVDDRGTRVPYVHVFKMNNTQGTSWTQTHLVRLSNDDPHWITFSIDGQYAYVAGPKGGGKPTDIISTSSYKRVGRIAASEDLLEVDFSNGAVNRVGNQFGLGRVP
jgi:hypothetical protein